MSKFYAGQKVLVKGIPFMYCEKENPLEMIGKIYEVRSASSKADFVSVWDENKKFGILFDVDALEPVSN